MHQQTDDIITVTRQFDYSKAWDAYFTIVRCSYGDKKANPNCSEVIQLPGTLNLIVLVAYINDNLKP